MMDLSYMVKMRMLLFDLFCLYRYSLKLITGRVGVVAITLASHARGREFNPRIRYFFTFFLFHISYLLFFFTVSFPKSFYFYNPIL